MQSRGPVQTRGPQRKASVGGTQLESRCLEVMSGLQDVPPNHSIHQGAQSQTEHKPPQTSIV